MNFLDLEIFLIFNFAISSKAIDTYIDTIPGTVPGTWGDEFDSEVSVPYPYKISGR